MADLHQAFGKFHARIALTSGNGEVIRMAREAVRRRIREYFRDILNVEIPKFRSQGGYAMGTLVNPVCGEYDIDDGVYLQHLDNLDDGSWPSAETVHQWLVHAIDGYGRGEAIDKRACVRMRYAGLYHLDLPAYGQFRGKLRLAAKGATPWPHSDPSVMTKWFESYANFHGAQLRRIVRYLKAWSDFQSAQYGRITTGLILTVLGTRHYQKHAKDDAALAGTFKVISTALQAALYVPNPADVEEDLAARLSRVQKLRFQSAINVAAIESLKAIATKNDLKASILWQRLLGDRFPTVEA